MKTIAAAALAGAAALAFAGTASAHSAACAPDGSYVSDDARYTLVSVTNGKATWLDGYNDRKVYPACPQPPAPTPAPVPPVPEDIPPPVYRGPGPVTTPPPPVVKTPKVTRTVKRTVVRQGCIFRNGRVVRQGRKITRITVTYRRGGKITKRGTVTRITRNGGRCTYRVVAG